MRALQILLIVAVGCLVSLPLIVHGVSIMSADGWVHSLWYASFSDQLWAGDPYPRWLWDMNNGLGSPTLFYYPPVPFFITSILRPLFPGDVSGVYEVGISAAAAVIASGVFIYVWLKQLTESFSAVIAAILFMIAPYHLVMDVYLRTALAELWAFAWMPLILYFTQKVSKGNKWAAAGLAISYALLIGTHLPTTLMFSLIPVGYVLAIADRGQKKARLLFVAASMTLGIGLSAIFLYPAMTTQSFVFLDRMEIAYFSYQNWFLFSKFDNWPDDKMRWLLLVADLALIAGCAYAVTRRISNDKLIKNNAAFWLAVATASLLMMTEVSAPIWSIVTPLQKLQFPWRFNVILVLAVTVLAGLAISSVQKSRADITAIMIVALFAVFSWIPAAAWGSASYFMPTQDPDDVQFRRKEVDEKRERPEYRPRWSQSMETLEWETSNQGNWVFLEKEFDSLLQRNNAAGKDPSRVQLVDGTGQSEILSWRSRNILLHTSSPAGMKVRILQFYYPGWQAKMTDTLESLDLRPSEPDGLLTLDVPAGEHNVSVRLGQTDAERIGKYISLASLVLLVLYVFIIGTNKLLTAQRMPVQ